MDILSDTLSALRTGRPASVRTDARAPWGLRFPPVAGAGFHVVLQGSCLLVPPDGPPVPLGPGDVIFLRSGCQHLLCDDPASPVRDFTPDPDDAGSPVGRITVGGAGARAVVLCGAYHLDVARHHPLLGDLPEVLHLPARVGWHQVLRSAIDQLSTELVRPTPGSDAVVVSLIDLLLVLILRAWYDEQSPDRVEGWAAALTDPVIAPALHAMHDEPGRPWTVESLGDRAGLSRAAFARRFSAVLGEPPLSYLTTWRMTTAARLLRDTDTTLHGIAESAGYTSEFAFAKAFKRRYDVPPGTYRRQHRAS
ncbi:AraC family transcriptional regulator [Solihabitans fulvus]|uniref:AraC family transcriptional regulator n=1 Tax=Solihabitans fulvus TaxID=1892852 RepID=A0A5B2XBA5_9PSEU|nr:AraC family transcriptional regulator [Solihabitans fulvus]KAA2260444.1 AraC family transcriptional regulator [Solihabitans fulvus]